MKPLIKCVGFLLIKNNKILVEKRKTTKKIDPGKYCIPSGGIEGEETPFEAVTREVKEEFDIGAKKITFIGSLIYETSEVDFDIYYHIVTKWDGDIKILEAESLDWREISRDSVDIWPDKLIIEAVLERGGYNNE